MKNLLLVFMLLLAGTSAVAQKTQKKPKQPEAKPATELKNGIDSASYAYGILLADQLKEMVSKVYNADLVVDALSAVMRNEKTVIPQADAIAIFQSYEQEIRNKIAEIEKVEAEAAKAEGEKFLEENKKRQGVMSTTSGLQYEILTKGTGTVSPLPADQVKVHYHGTTIDGAMFDSSVERGEPVTFGLDQVIPGWTEGLQLMHAGDKFKFFIPANLAYGDRSPTPKIKANSVLIFEVELIEINPTE